MGALSGIKVVELAGFGPGPMAGMMLADHGADVVRIERIGTQDVGFDVVATRFLVHNRGKRSLMLNLKETAGVAAAMAVIERADVLIDGFRPGVLERLGLGPDVCLARNAGLVYGRITGFGQTGPLAARAGHDINYSALSGVVSLIGPPEGPPVVPLNLISDFGGGALYLLFGVLAALLERQRSGRGQVIDSAMVDGCISLMSSTFGYLASGFHTLERGTNLLDGGAPYFSIYRTADGMYVSIGALEPQFFARLAAEIGIDARWNEWRRDRDRWPELRSLLDAVFVSKTRAEWEARLGGIDVCFAPVLTPIEAARHPHLADRGSTMELSGVLQPSPAPRLDRTPAAVRGEVPIRGRDGEAVLAEAGYDAARIADLRNAGILG